MPPIRVMPPARSFFSKRKPQRRMRRELTEFRLLREC
jgi:hypothetical protein